MTIYHSSEKAIGLKLKKKFHSAQTMDAPPSLLYFWPLHFVGNQGAGPELQQLLNTISLRHGFFTYILRILSIPRLFEDILRILCFALNTA